MSVLLNLFKWLFSDLIYDFMMMLSSRLTEVDVSTILTVLNCKILDTAMLYLFLLEVGKLAGHADWVTGSFWYGSKLVGLGWI